MAPRSDLNRELAPLTDAAWSQLEGEARRTLENYLAARKLVDFRGPLGWQHAAVSLGRVEALDEAGRAGVQARLRRVQPLIELRAPFTLARSELEALERGAEDADLAPLVEAARRLALAEDGLVFGGAEAAGVVGLGTGSAHEVVALPRAGASVPAAIATALQTLREAGIAGPYGIALEPVAYNALASTALGSHTALRFAEQLLGGPVIWAPGLSGALVVSLRGGDFELTVGRDISLGHLGHDRDRVELYLEESLTFRLLTPEAVVALRREPA